MGAQASTLIDCDSCLAPVIKLVDGGKSEAEDAENSRLGPLCEGAEFQQKAMGGLTSNKVFVKLSADHSSLDWKVEGSMLQAESFGSVDMTCAGKVAVDHQKGLKVMSEDKKKELFQCYSESTEVRDQWVIALNELLDKWREQPDSKPQSNQSAAKTSDKAEYFAKREKEMEARKAAAAAKREKYASVGMKHTAAAMMRA